MKKRSFRSTFVSVILVITVAISIVNLAVYGINIKKIRQVEVLKMKTAGERIDDMITISLNNIKGLKQICCTDNYARNILLKNNEKNDIGTKFENQNYMDNALKHIASMDTLILRATIVNKYGNIYCTDTSIPEEYVKTIRNMTKEWMLFEGKEDEYYYGGLQGDNANILTFLYPLHTYGNTPIALLAVDINYKTFQSILENVFYENSGECFILTGEQELFHIGEDLYQKEEKGYIFDKSQKMMKENLIVDTFQSKGKNFYISSRQNMLSGWKIIQVIPEERLFEEVDQKIKWNSIFLLGALILVVSFSIYYTKKIIEPLEEFCKKISHTKGDQLQIINLEHMKLTREIANVIENYNEMANKMNEYLVREIIYDKNQRKIQSKMLRYQINPHFLYNETMYLYADEEFYGFGEKFTDFGKRGQTINCWQTDALSTNTEKSYKNHPFFMSSRGYAILLNTYTRSKFEMGSFSNVAYNMSVEDKVLDYVIWMGNDYKALLKSYINQTGKIPMIPKWALGLWMSKCSYQTQDEIYEVVKISKERDIKIDVIHIDGWQKEGDAGAWVWDYERFPNPEEMIYKLKKEGIHLCLWIFPYIDENSKYFKEAEEKGFLVKNTKGVTSRFYSTATSTSKVGCFDFTNPHFIEWYKPKVRSVVSMGIGAVKTDFSEAVPEDAVYFDGSTGIQGHNKLTFLYAKTIYDIMAEVKIPLGELPMLWGRSGYAGSHTIPAAWAGDSSTHLNNHACILRGGLSASMSGIPFWGFDMGGFYNTDHEGYECVPTDEEYIRSCQFGFFNSLSRCHGKTPREPWNFGEKAEKIFKKFNDIRHLLLPYLYSTTYKTHLSDIPVIRPVVMEYPEDRSARNVELEYFLGDSLLVVPVFDQEDEIDVYLPNGQWIDLFTHERIKGGRWVKRKIELDKIPVFIRQNKMIPMLTKIPENIEEKYENLDVILFCEDEIRDTYIDDGNVQNLKAKIEEGTLFINTDMDASYFTVYAEKCLDNAVVNGQNWEIKKEKEGYYKIALEK